MILPSWSLHRSAGDGECANQSVSGLYLPDKRKTGEERVIGVEGVRGVGKAAILLIGR